MLGIYLAVQLAASIVSFSTATTATVWRNPCSAALRVPRPDKFSCFFSSSVFAERDFARSRLDVSGWVRQVRTFADSTTVYSSGIFTLALNIYVDILNPNAKKSDIFTVSRCRSINWLCCVLS
jgi:hypothetical protein